VKRGRAKVEEKTAKKGWGKRVRNVPRGTRVQEERLKARWRKNSRAWGQKCDRRKLKSSVEERGYETKTKKGARNTNIKDQRALTADNQQLEKIHIKDEGRI